MLTSIKKKICVLKNSVVSLSMHLLMGRRHFSSGARLIGARPPGKIDVTLCCPLLFLTWGSPAPEHFPSTCQSALALNLQLPLQKHLIPHSRSRLSRILYTSKWKFLAFDRKVFRSRQHSPTAPHIATYLFNFSSYFEARAIWESDCLDVLCVFVLRLHKKPP